MRTQFTTDSGLKYCYKATVYKMDTIYLVENNRVALYTWHFLGGKNHKCTLLYTKTYGVKDMD